MRAQQPQRPTSNEESVAWRAYWTALGTPWRTEPEIAAERQRFLATRRAVHPDIQAGIYPFRSEHGGIALSRADVEWLLATHESGGMQGPVDWRDARQHAREGLDVRGADLQGADLRALPLARLRAGLTKDEWIEAPTQARDAAAVTLTGATLVAAHLGGAFLANADVRQADLRDAHLERADLYRARLEGARLSRAQLHGASLRVAFFDATSNLDEVVLGSPAGRGALVAGTHWGSTDLSGVQWAAISMLGDEAEARQWKAPARDDESRRMRLLLWDTAVRANRQLAVALRDQGLNEDADRFTYRAQVLQQVVLRRQGMRKWPAYLGSLCLWVLAGYGYRLWRIFAAYALVLLGFAATYFLLGIPGEPAGDVQTHALNALLISLTAVHGRVFFEQFNFSPQAWVAAIESVVGIVIEGVFVAMLIQRWFQR